jgi:heat shock protein 5
MWGHAVAVADAGLDKREIDHIVLVGGSTRIPKLQQLVRDYFDSKEPLSGINPDEAMAYGAAVQGSFFAARHDEEPHSTLVFNILPSLTSLFFVMMTIRFGSAEKS